MRWLSDDDDALLLDKDSNSTKIFSSNTVECQSSRFVSFRFIGFFLKVFFRIPVPVQF